MKLPIFKRPSRKLGKKAPKLDHRTLKLSNYIETALLPPVPEVRYWSKDIDSWPLYLNDTLGDCTIASLAHQIMVWTNQASGHTTKVSNHDVLKAYEAVSGYTPSDPSTDQGAEMLPVMKYFRKVGIGCHRSIGFVAIDKKMPLGGPLEELLQVIDLFGGAYLGVALPASAQDQVKDGGEWKVLDSGPHGDGEPGTWGGHAIVATAYNKYGVICPTWDLEMLLSWNFLHYYCDEAYAILSSDWLHPNKVAPSGFNLKQLCEDIMHVSAGK